VIAVFQSHTILPYCILPDQVYQTANQIHS
jgi:hypothetical protein